MAGVKRRYSGEQRKAQAERVRQLPIDAAGQQLLSFGYSGTIIPKVAQSCRVSAESAYKRLPGKPALLRAVVSRPSEVSGR